MLFNESGRQTKPTGEGGKEQMIALNDYLYSGDTVLRILQKYSSDLERSACYTFLIRQIIW